MVLLLFFDFLGILLSFFAYLCLLLDFSLPTDELALIVDIGIGVAFGGRLFITKGLRQGNDWFFDKSLKNLCPSWLKVTMGLIIAYGIVSGILSLIGMFSVISVTMTKNDYIVATKKLFIGLFLLTMAYYAVEFWVLYSYRILKGKRQQKLKDEGTMW